jgi:hypothetical protein
MNRGSTPTMPPLRDERAVGERAHRAHGAAAEHDGEAALRQTIPRRRAASWYSGAQTRLEAQ